MNNEKNCSTNLLMTIEGFFSTCCKEIVIHGVVKETVTKGDTVLINGLTYTVDQIEINAIQLANSAKAGTYVGLLQLDADAANFQNGYDVFLVNSEQSLSSAQDIASDNKQKMDVLYQAVNSEWENAFCGWEWDESDKPGLFILGDPTRDHGYTFFLAGFEDGYGGWVYSGWIWIEYEPEKDVVGIYIKNEPIKEKFKDDLMVAFDKHAPFGMKLSFENQTTPIISRKEKVEVQDLQQFFKDFRQAYNEYYPLFYMVTVSTKQWYDGFHVTNPND